MMIDGLDISPTALVRIGEFLKAKHPTADHIEITREVRKHHVNGFKNGYYVRAWTTGSLWWGFFHKDGSFHGGGWS